MPFFILIQKKGTNRYLGAIPLKTGTAQRRLTRIRKSLKKGFSARIASQKEFERILLRQPPTTYRKARLTSKRRKPKKTHGVFGQSKNKLLAKRVSITSPSAFMRSIRMLRKRGLTLREFRALTLAKTRAKLQLRRKNLSSKERKQLRAISRIRIPRPTMKKKQ